MIIDLGLIDYEEAYGIQKETVARRKLGETDDVLIIAEHYPVFTIGRSGSRINLLADEKDLDGMGIKVLSVDRGGDITFHGPGQLVAYPIIDLGRGHRDLHMYMRHLEEAAIVFFNAYSVPAVRVAGRTGAWVSGRKVASIGVGASGWVTYHGLSINLNVDLAFFSMINPCGFKDSQAGSLDRIIGRAVDTEEAKSIFIDSFNRVFDFADIRCRGSRQAALA